MKCKICEMNKAEDDGICLRCSFNILNGTMGIVGHSNKGGFWIRKPKGRHDLNGTETSFAVDKRR